MKYLNKFAQVYVFRIMHQLKWLIISAVFAIDVSNAQILQPGVNPLAAAGLPFGRRDLRDAAVRIDDVTAQELERQTEQEIIASSHWLANAQVSRDVM